MTIGIDGGTSGPMMQEAQVSAPAYSTGYPSSFIALISRMPRPPASAMAEPDMPEKIRLPRTFTWASPPVKCPTSAFAKP
jgi:hypothetical protein